MLGGEVELLLRRFHEISETLYNKLDLDNEDMIKHFVDKEWLPQNFIVTTKEFDDIYRINVFLDCILEHIKNNS